MKLCKKQNEEFSKSNNVGIRSPCASQPKQFQQLTRHSSFWAIFFRYAVPFSKMVLKPADEAGFFILEH